MTSLAYHTMAEWFKTDMFHYYFAITLFRACFWDINETKYILFLILQLAIKTYVSGKLPNCLPLPEVWNPQNDKRNCPYLTRQCRQTRQLDTFEAFSWTQETLEPFLQIKLHWAFGKAKSVIWVGWLKLFVEAKEHAIKAWKCGWTFDLSATKAYCCASKCASL
jgi:hypothetical protein